MNNKYKIAYLGLLIAVFAVIMAVSANAQTTTTNGGDDISGSTSSVTSGFAAVTSNGGDDISGLISSSTSGSTASTSNGGDDINGSTTSGTSGSTAGTSNGGDDVAGSSTNNGTGGSTATTTNGGDDIAGASTTPPAVTPPGGGGGGGGGSISSSGSSGSYSSGGGSSIYPLLAVANTGTSSCPLITTYMKSGANNNASDVAKLQAFLKNILGINLIVNGQFDQPTLSAVRAFQTKYLSDIMGPWGATQSSGFVYITTLKEINKLACSSPFVLSAADMSIINAYKARLVNGDLTGGNLGTGPVLETGTSTGSTSTDIGSNANGSQTAAVGNTSILARFWNFILSLFR